MISVPKKNFHQITQLFLNISLMLKHITTALALVLRVPLALNQTTLVCVKRHSIMKPISGRQVMQSW